MDMSKWDNEYLKQGIPSSFRDEPSGVLVWFIKNLEFLGLKNMPLTVLDVGCGKGRNPYYLASNGFDVVAFDSSKVAIEIAEKLVSGLKIGNKPKFLVQELQNGLPGGPNEFDLITDIFVYKHQTDINDRRKYRKNLNYSLRVSGLLLISLADKNDGYYSQCPIVENNNQGLMTIIDPEVKVESVLFSLEELIQEMSDYFTLDMVWIKSKEGIMHNKTYLRKTFATIWRPKK